MIFLSLEAFLKTLLTVRLSFCRTAFSMTCIKVWSSLSMVLISFELVIQNLIKLLRRKWDWFYHFSFEFDGPLAIADEPIVVPDVNGAHLAGFAVSNILDLLTALVPGALSDSHWQLHYQHLHESRMHWTTMSWVHPHPYYHAPLQISKEQYLINPLHEERLYSKMHCSQKQDSPGTRGFEFRSKWTTPHYSAGKLTRSA